MNSAQRCVSDEQPETSYQNTPPIEFIDSYEKMVAQEQPTNFPAAPVPLIWNTKNTLTMLQCLWNKKPAGRKKFENILLARRELNLCLKLNVPITEVWNFLTSRYNLEKADEIEYDVDNLYFPKSPKREHSNADEKEATEAVAETTVEAASPGPAATTRRGDIRVRRTPKVILEKIDSKLNARQMEQLLKYKAEFENRHNAVQTTASTSSKLKNASKRKR